MPATNPIAVMTPTFIHEGRSSAGLGTCTLRGASTFGENIELGLTTAIPRGAKTLRRAAPGCGSRAFGAASRPDDELEE
jgi:hypothetical protein